MCIGSAILTAALGTSASYGRQKGTAAAVPWQNGLKLLSGLLLGRRLLRARVGRRGGGRRIVALRLVDHAVELRVVHDLLRALVRDHERGRRLLDVDRIAPEIGVGPGGSGELA